MSGQNGTPAGWYPDPSDSQRVRYWDGSNWSGPSRSASPSTATSGFLESSASTRAPRPWWQTWFAIVPGLLLCLPLGLVGLWRRQGTSTVAKTVVRPGRFFCWVSASCCQATRALRLPPFPQEPPATLHLHPRLHDLHRRRLHLHPRLHRWLGFQLLRGLVWSTRSANYAPPGWRWGRSIADRPASGRTPF
jgi:hypothetical protein